MADNPSGFRMVGHALGGKYVGRLSPAVFPSGYATPVFIGDPVVKLANGANSAKVDSSAGSFPPGSLREINQAEAGATKKVTGVLIGLANDATSSSNLYHPASTEQVALICDDPYAIFEVQDDASAALTTAVVGVDANFVLGSGNTVTGISTAELDATTPAADVTYQMNIVAIAPYQDNTVGNNMKYHVRFNLHTEIAGVIGI